MANLFGNFFNPTDKSWEEYGQAPSAPPAPQMNFAAWKNAEQNAQILDERHKQEEEWRKRKAEERAAIAQKNKETLRPATADDKLKEAEALKAYERKEALTNPKVTQIIPEDEQTTTTTEVAPTPEPQTQAIEPKSTLDYQGTTQGNPKWYYTDLAKDAYDQRMKDYQLAQSKIGEQQALYDKATQHDSNLYDRQEAAVKYFEDRANGVDKRNKEGGGWSDWLNPAGILKAPIRLLMGKETFDKESGQYVRQMPKNWDDLSWNLLRNVGSMMSGVSYTGGSGGKGGITFGYNPSVPMALYGLQRQNAYAPFKDWEALQKSFAEGATQPAFKPWTIDTPYPRVAHPFEEQMEKQATEEMALRHGINMIDQEAEYLGYPKDSAQYKMLQKSRFKWITDNMPDIQDYEKTLRDSGMFGEEEIQARVKAFIDKLFGTGDPVEEKRRFDEGLNLKREAEWRKAQKDYQDLMLKAQDLELKGKIAESNMLKNEAQTEYYLAKARGTSTANLTTDKEGRLIPKDENGEPVVQDNTQQRYKTAVGLIQSGSALINKQDATLEELMAWKDAFDGDGNSYMNKNYTVKKAKDLYLTDEKDQFGTVQSYGLQTIDNEITARINAMVEQMAQAEAIQKQINGEAVPPSPATAPATSTPSSGGAVAPSAVAPTATANTQAEAPANTQRTYEEIVADMPNIAKRQAEERQAKIAEAVKQAQDERSRQQWEDFIWGLKHGQDPVYSVATEAQKNVARGMRRLNQADAEILFKLGKEYITPEVMSEIVKRENQSGMTYGKSGYALATSPYSVPTAVPQKPIEAIPIDKIAEEQVKAETPRYRILSQVLQPLVEQINEINERTGGRVKLDDRDLNELIYSAIDNLDPAIRDFIKHDEFLPEAIEDRWQMEDYGKAPVGLKSALKYVAPETSDLNVAIVKYALRQVLNPPQQG